MASAAIGNDGRGRSGSKASRTSLPREGEEQRFYQEMIDRPRDEWSRSERRRMSELVGRSNKWRRPGRAPR